MIKSTKASIASVKEKLGELTTNLWDEEKNEIINEYKEKGEMKLQELAEMLNSNTDLFKKAGFEVSSINASLGMPPDISITFKYLGAVSEDERNEILLKIKDSKMVSVLLKSLFKASKFSESIKVGQYKLNNINIKLGLIPGIGISFT
ncbi:MAG TPA: hypothetical protein VLB50_06775 [Ignavibacteriaceae bacterium]|nr:hypothetical protein [Ignavibacteriaceae bacterium]